MKTRAAFSLVEVMVAIVILAIALTGLTQGITTALGSSKESELQTTAALFAAGQIELLRAQRRAIAARAWRCIAGSKPSAPRTLTGCTKWTWWWSTRKPARKFLN